MKKVISKGKNAIQIFYDFERLENRLPSKNEFDLAYYGRTLTTNQSNYYYTVRRRFMAEKQEREENTNE